MSGPFPKQLPTVNFCDDMARGDRWWKRVASTITTCVTLCNSDTEQGEADSTNPPASCPEMSLQTVKVEFSGGCELLFGKKSSITLTDVVPAGSTLLNLVQILKQSYIVERPEQFVDATGTTLRPGVLALVNNCDAEVMGGMTYVLEQGDVVEFVSTLHGG